jgi:hypothetical protein
MPWSGGAFTRTNGVHTGATLWTQDRDAGTKILASRHDTHDQDLAGGINSTLEKSGSNAATGNLNIGSNRLTAVADGTAKTDAATVNQIQSNAPAFQATDTGTANAHVIALSPAITAYAAGQAITFKSGAASTTSSTLNVNGLGVKTIKKKNDQNIAAGDIESGSIVTVVYDGTNFQMTSQGATDEGLDLGAVSGIIESNANFIDMCLVGPSVDGMSWNGHFSKASVWTSLMLATVETSGSDAQVNIWDLTGSTLASATPLATLTLTGATPTSIAASMGYVMVGTSDQGVHVVAPHDTGAWAEKTEGWPRSLTSSTTPGLVTNNINDVAAGVVSASPFDPRTGGMLPSFGVAYAATEMGAVIKADGGVWDKSGAVADTVTFVRDRFVWSRSDDYVLSSANINTITADDFQLDNVQATTAGGNYGLGADTALDGFGNLLVGADAGGLTTTLLDKMSENGEAQYPLNALVTRSYSTGFLGNATKLAALANSDTADRSGNSHTLTENGTVVEAAVASGAELKAYSSWSASNFMSSNDATFDIGDNPLLINCWFKLTASTTTHNVITEYYLDGAAATDARWLLSYYQPSDALYFFVQDQGGTALEVNASGLGIDDDGLWHQAIVVWNNVTHTSSVYMDGVFVKSGTNTGVDSLTNTSNTFKIGTSFDAANGFNGDLPFGGSLSLFRLSSTVLTATQIRRMYEAEAPMFAANAKVLLQSGSTDAVLDAKVDPLSGKYIVTQTDSQEIFDGLAIETERTIATGGSTFEHGLLFGDAVAEINNANLFASTPATDQRQVNEMVRSLSADLPAGVDLSKAKAWVVDTGKTGSTIAASLNIESGAYDATGIYTFVFAVPFKTVNYVVSVVADGDSTFGLVNTKTRLQCTVRFKNDAGTDTNSRFSAVFFGELENE